LPFTCNSAVLRFAGHRPPGRARTPSSWRRLRQFY
jgi:hypothetical protein